MPRKAAQALEIPIAPKVPFMEIPVRSDEDEIHSKVDAISWSSVDIEHRVESRGVAIRITHIRRRGQLLTRKQYQGVSMSVAEAELVYAQLGAAIARAKQLKRDKRTG